jgi:hypothetical protein
VPNTSRTLDLDGMTVMTGLEVDIPVSPDAKFGLNLDLEPVVESPEEEAEELAAWSNDPATATWAPMMAEVKSALHLACARLT